MAQPDLNLMVIFDAIMQEQSITAAAHRLSMTQPSVSNAVSRMRHLWQDPMFIKNGRGVRPTPFAYSLWRRISEPLATIKSASQRPEFDITNDKRTFRIAATDWMVDIFWLPLRKRLEAQAPKINLHAVPYAVNGEQLLLDADVDLVLDFFEGKDSRVETQWLFDNRFVCAMRPDHPLATTDLDINTYADAEHLLFSLSGDALGDVDKLLQQQGLSRRIAMTVNHGYGLQKLLASTDLITTIPAPIIFDSVNNGQLITRSPPVNITPAPISMSWHTRMKRDTTLLWLRTQILDVLQAELPDQIADTTIVN
ncbi:Nodulation protein D 2 [BD1-7 clade bacterium]|uniref:Nodulation protein D 2 n=1 Tax=BD1-7 clade bacterium TaxID=2029982 RepID=A0A5S9PXU9_9GAMM|nr:Nodulation protein D 2 [BD1-7 clade bacterium]CAA0113277.1 Nodulation protein D 2 [BD1-7 clade bacterium]